MSNSTRLLCYIEFSNSVHTLVNPHVTGKTYALHIMKVVTVRILRKFKLTSQVKLEDIEYELKVFMFS